MFVARENARASRDLLLVHTQAFQKNESTQSRRVPGVSSGQRVTMVIMARADKDAAASSVDNKSEDVGEIEM